MTPVVMQNAIIHQISQEKHNISKFGSFRQQQMTVIYFSTWLQIAESQVWRKSWVKSQMTTTSNQVLFQTHRSRSFLDSLLCIFNLEQVSIGRKNRDSSIVPITHFCLAASWNRKWQLWKPVLQWRRIYLKHFAHFVKSLTKLNL